MTPAQQKALDDYNATIAKYQQGGRKEGTVAGVASSEDVGPSAMGDVKTDPTYNADEMEALKGLETQSQQGLTDRDKADIAQTEMSADRANKGRVDAIKQGMAAHGMGGSGMDMVAQMQSAQGSNELQAMKALETAGQSADRRTAATTNLGNMSSRMQAQDFQQQAQKAQAADQIARFNNQNRTNANQWNTQNAQNVANANTTGDNAFASSSMDAGLKGAGTAYNAATEDYNQQLLQEQQRRQRAAAQNHAYGQIAGSVVGGVAGGVTGGPMGAAAGSSAGGALGGGIADATGPGYWHGGKIPGKAAVPGDSPANDTILTPTSPGEVVVPRSVVATHHDVIGHLLDAAAKLHKSGKNKQ
jgi:hypothetical protein